MEVRPARAEDAQAWVDVLRAASPYLVTAPDAVVDSLASPRRLGHAVATTGDTVLGVARLAEPTPEGVVTVQLQVHPQRRGAGAGGALLQWARSGASAAGATKLTAIAHQDGVEVAQHWGCVIGRQHTISTVDPREVQPPPPASPATVDLETAGPRAVWECYQATALDDPSGLSQPEPYETFLAEEWQGPVQRPDLGRAVLVDGVVAAFSFVITAQDRAWNAFTGTHPRHRGHGLATVAKRAALRALADNGITRCGTGNDSANLPMLAVNKRLGYHPLTTTYGVSLDLP